jgi:lysophospholipase L1-like esterase
MLKKHVPGLSLLARTTLILAAVGSLQLASGCGSSPTDGGTGGAVGNGGSGGAQGGAGGSGAAGKGGSPAVGGSGGSGGTVTGEGGCSCVGGSGGGVGGGSGGTKGGNDGGAPDAKPGDASPDGATADATPGRDATGTPDQGGQSDTLAKPDGSATGPAAVRLVGRFDKYDSTPAKFGWVGSAMVARFDGTGATIQLDGSDDRYQVIVDGKASSTVLKVTSSGKFQIAKDLPAGVHDVVVWRRSESNWSNASYLGLEVTGGQLVAPPDRPSRRIEIYGDSITAGYGLDGANASCSMSQDNSNHYLTYGALTARSLSAELHAIAWSGIGMYRNYGESAPKADSLTMPKVYARLMPATDSAWDFKSWEPHAVVINLGTNDASSNGDPGTPYRTAYLEFVRTLRKNYPNTFFVLSIGPMLSGTQLSAIRGHIQAVIKTLSDEGDKKMSYLEFPTQDCGSSPYPNCGCDWHPNAATNAKMADLLVAELKKQLSW